MEFIKNGISFLTPFGLTVPLLAFVILWVFSWRRTKSSYSIMAKLWQLMHRKEKCKDTDINNYMFEQHALMKFRFTTGINARSLKNSKDIITWSKNHDVSLDTIKACRSFFDIENVRLKDDKDLPNKYSIFGRLLLTGFAASVTVFFICLAIPNSAWVTMTKTGTQVILSSDEARLFFHEGRSIHRQQCIDNGKVTDTGFSDEDAQAICNVFKNKDISAYVEKAVSQQRYTSLIVSPLLFITFWLLLGNMFSAMSAEDLQLRLRRNAKAAAAI